MLLGIILGLTQSISKVWRTAAGEALQYSRSRDAMEVISRRIGSATLNTYWDIERLAGTPSRYVRQSELRWLAGPAASLLSQSANKFPGSAVFFQAPTGIFSNSAATSRLKESLNTWGYFVEYASDSALRPEFLDGIIPPRYRFRMYEMLEPTDELSIFNYTSGIVGGAANNLTYTTSSPDGKNWFLNTFNQRFNIPSSKARVLADNVIAAVFLCRLSESDDSTKMALSPSFLYDSTVSRNIAELNSKNQLPPIVEVILVCLDDSTAARFDWPDGTPPDFGQSDLLGATSIGELDERIEIVIKNLQSKGIQARTFRTSVAIQSSKWSTEQEN